MTVSVSRIINILNPIAPPKLAEHWDSVGLQVGSYKWNVNKIWTALDPLLNLVEHACSENVDLLITHHPLFLKHLSKIDVDSVKGKIINLALKKKLAIFCMHTNFDSASKGVNDVLANAIGLTNIKVLGEKKDTNKYKLVFFAPLDSEKIILEALFSTGTGQIGRYSCCSFRSKGIGSFLPGINSTPYIGTNGSLTEIEEIRIETIADRQNIDDIIDSVKHVHPYETIPYDIYPVFNRTEHGIGRIGKLENKTTLYKFIKQIKQKLNLNMIKVSGDLNSTVESVAICSGSGSSMMEAFLSSNSQVYISGDISYHNARDAEEKGLATIDIGHFQSEQIAISNLTNRLKQLLKVIDTSIYISKANFESDVFKFL